MREKLLDLMKNEGLKPGQLAEMLEVNPAGISHILAGRNKPGFEMLQKILRRFPQINPDWLLLDSDKMYRDDVDRFAAQPTAESTASSNDLFAASPEGRTVSEKHASDTTPRQTIPGNSSTELPLQIPATSKVKRIIVLYDDQTFESYTPTMR